MPTCDSFRGFLDVKIKGKVQRGFTPWKAWHKQWCEIRRMDNIENGAELRLRTNQSGSIVSQVTLPRAATLCRIESRSKKYAFGVFVAGHTQKPLLFLSGYSESDSQLWMSRMRRFLSIATYLPVGGCSFHVSLIDGEHSNLAKLTGLFGILQTNPQGISICDPSTGEERIAWKWCEFHQFHLQAPPHPADEQRICVMHTSREFVAGQGQLYVYCDDASRLLETLLSRGKPINGSFLSIHRISRSEGDLSSSYPKKAPLGTPDSFRSSSNSSSNDSGVETLLAMQETDFSQKTCDIMAKTPGGSEADDEDPVTDICCGADQLDAPCIPRRESGLSLSSGIYEEISETLPTVKSKCNIYSNDHVHLYEDLEEISLKKKCIGPPPPLPPRVFKILDDGGNHKFRSNTLPARDLKRISQTFANSIDSEYMVMSSKGKTGKKPMVLTDSAYVSMSSGVVQPEIVSEESYMVMSARRE